MTSDALEAARRSGLIAPGEPLLVLLSGGADSVCLLDVALELGAGDALTSPQLPGFSLALDELFRER